MQDVDSGIFESNHRHNTAAFACTSKRKRSQEQETSQQLAKRTALAQHHVHDAYLTTVQLGSKKNPHLSADPQSSSRVIVTVEEEAAAFSEPVGGGHGGFRAYVTQKSAKKPTLATGRVSLGVCAHPVCVFPFVAPG